MTSPTTFPRLPQNVAESVLSEQRNLSASQLTERAATTHLRQEWHPTIPTRVTEENLQHLRSEVVDLAVGHGYPNPQPRGGYASFEQEVSTLLYNRMGIVPAEAAVGGVWSFIALVLLPDVAAWRWSDGQPYRFIGSDLLIGNNRHAFGRLWARAHVLGAYACAGLAEDNMVQILERSTFGGDERLAKAIAYVHLRTLSSSAELASQDLMRDAMKRLRRLAVLVTFIALSDSQLREVVDEVFMASETALRHRKASAA